MLIRIAVVVAAVLAPAAPAAAAPSWLPPVPLTAEGMESRAPVLAVAPDGTTVAAWSRAEGGTSVVEALVRRPGAAFGEPVVLGAADASAPQVGIDATGEATVVWQDGAGIRVARLAAGSASFAVDPQLLAAGASSPVLSVGAGGTAVVLMIKDGALQATIRDGASGSFSPAAPISTSPGSAAEVAVAPDGRAVAAWSQEGVVYTNERPAGGAFAAAGTARTVAPATAGDPAVAVDGQGRAVVAWTHDPDGGSPGPAEVRAAAAPFTSPAPASSPGAAAGTPDLAIAADGSVVGAWIRDGLVEVATAPAGTAAFAGHGSIPVAAAATAVPAVAVGGDGGTVVAWAGPAAVHAAHRQAGGDFTVATLGAGAGAGDPVLGADDQGNATAAWLTPDRRVAAAGFDAAAPAITGLDVPATATARASVPMTAAASDRWGPLTLSWAFGDGGSAAGGAVAHAFGAAGAFDVTVTATDAAGNARSLTRRVDVAAAPIPPPAALRVDASVALRWRVRGRTIKLERMRLTRLPAGTEAELRCRGRRCPIRRTRIFTPRRGAIDVVKPLDVDQRRFRAGQRLALRISAPGHVGQVLRFKLKRGTRPTAVERCMPAGSTAVRRSC